LIETANTVVKYCEGRKPNKIEAAFVNQLYHQILNDQHKIVEKDIGTMTSITLDDLSKTFSRSRRI